MPLRAPPSPLPPPSGLAEDLHRLRMCHITITDFVGELPSLPGHAEQRGFKAQLRAVSSVLEVCRAMVEHDSGAQAAPYPRAKAAELHAARECRAAGSSSLMDAGLVDAVIRLQHGTASAIAAMDARDPLVAELSEALRRGYALLEQMVRIRRLKAHMVPHMGMMLAHQWLDVNSEALVLEILKDNKEVAPGRLLTAQQHWGGGGGVLRITGGRGGDPSPKPPSPPPKTKVIIVGGKRSHVEETLSDQAQARASYSPPFWRLPRSIPQDMVSDVRPLVQSSFWDRK